MPTFKYKAVSRDGGPVHGVIQAYDEFEAVDRIRETCSLVTSITQVADLPRTSDDLFGPPKVPHKALALLCSQFAIILTAGLPVVRAVKLIEGQTADRNVKKLLSQVAEDVSAGYGLAQSFENKGGKMLPSTFIETIRAGEESGSLEASFQKLFTYYDKSAKVKARVRSAMIYPIFLSVLAALVVGIIMVFVMPVFADLFESMNAQLPALTLGLMAVSGFLAGHWWQIFLAVVAFILAFRFYNDTEQGGLRLSRLQLRLPALGRVAEMKGASQLANTLSTLLTSGLPMVQAVQTTARVLDSLWLGSRLALLVPALEEGRRLGACLRECGCFPELLCEMTAVGEETGSLEETLTTIGAYYDSEVEVASQRALSMLQPAITVVMGIIIGIIVIALYLPMFTMYDNMA
ncbi:type II secretion system F family protein [uncultured Oscillibacter sp.]|uniref:type II secretion system F family protein n=1 Tax=uncultured Oscillibacter sp. TaxID=876091 RepID=UPI0025F9C48B|nr:type II secretion system F family protein [uncultured Oscillibacter sp.]